MIKRHSILFYVTIIFFLGACTSHPPVMPEVPKEGETKMGFSFSVENVIPTIWWKYGLNDYILHFAISIRLPRDTFISFKAFQKRFDLFFIVQNFLQLIHLLIL